jgi:hypothetical protein
MTEVETHQVQQEPFAAATHEEAASILHLRMGWEPYRPVGGAEQCPHCEACLYPGSSGECWRCGTA